VLNRECSREDDVLRAVASAYIDDDLRGHIASCAGCADLLAVATSVTDDRRMLMREATIPSSGLVWSRANMQARQQARRLVIRTATLVQIALIAAAIIVAIVVLGATPPRIDYRPLLTIPVFAFLAWLILAPVAVYFTVTED